MCVCFIFLTLVLFLKWQREKLHLFFFRICNIAFDSPLMFFAQIETWFYLLPSFILWNSAWDFLKHFLTLLLGVTGEPVLSTNWVWCLLEVLTQPLLASYFDWFIFYFFLFLSFFIPPPPDENGSMEYVSRMLNACGTSLYLIWKIIC